MSLSSTPRTWVAGEIVTAAYMNTEIRDAVTGMEAPFTAYTPAWTSSGTAPVLNNGTFVGKYSQVGKSIDFSFNLTPGSTTTFGTGNYSFSLPFTSVNDGIGTVVHAQLVIGAVRWAGQGLISPSSSTFGVYLSTSSTDPRLTQMTPTAPGTFANGSLLRVWGRFEAT